MEVSKKPVRLRVTRNPKSESKQDSFQKIFDVCGYDIWSLIFDQLSDTTCIQVGKTCKSANKFYKMYLERSRTYVAGTTRMYRHQLKMLNWILENMTGSNKLLCNAYMSAGKTLVGYETAYRLITDKKFTISGKIACYVLIIVPPNVIRVWMDEAKKHYPHLIGNNRSTRSVGKNKQILFYTHFSKKDQKYVNDCVPIAIIDDDEFKVKFNNSIRGLDKKIIVSTPNAVWDSIGKNASYIIFDECHKFIDKYETITCEKEGSPCLYFTASHFSKDYITKSYVLEKCRPFPNLKYRFIYLNSYDIPEVFIKDDLKDKLDKHIVILTPRKSDFKKYTTLGDRSIYDFTERQPTYYKKFKENGGVLISSTKTVSEGNNFNQCSLAYIIDPSLCTLLTLKQTIGRFYRQSNKHSTISLVFLVEKDTQIWARCRLGVITKELKGFDAKSNNQIFSINRFLKEKGYDIDRLTDDEVICLYATRDYKNSEDETSDNSDELSKLNPSYLKLQDLLRGVLF